MNNFYWFCCRWKTSLLIDWKFLRLSMKILYLFSYFHICWLLSVYNFYMLLFRFFNFSLLRFMRVRNTDWLFFFDILLSFYFTILFKTAWLYSYLWCSIFLLFFLKNICLFLLGKVISCKLFNMSAFSTYNFLSIKNTFGASFSFIFCYFAGPKVASVIRGMRLSNHCHLIFHI